MQPPPVAHDGSFETRPVPKGPAGRRETRNEAMPRRVRRAPAPLHLPCPSNAGGDVVPGMEAKALRACPDGDRIDQDARTFPRSHRVIAKGHRGDGPEPRTRARPPRDPARTRSSYPCPGRANFHIEEVSDEASRKVDRALSQWRIGTGLRSLDWPRRMLQQRRSVQGRGRSPAETGGGGSQDGRPKTAERKRKRSREGQEGGRAPRPSGSARRLKRRLPRRSASARRPRRRLPRRSGSARRPRRRLPRRSASARRPRPRRPRKRRSARRLQRRPQRKRRSARRPRRRRRRRSRN